MGASGLKQRATFTLDPGIKDQLERRVPQNERSHFVETAIATALKGLAKQDALNVIRRFKRFTLKGPGVVETCVKHARHEMSNWPPGIDPGANDHFLRQLE